MSRRRQTAFLDALVDVLDRIEWGAQHEALFARPYTVREACVTLKHVASIFRTHGNSRGLSLHALDECVASRSFGP